MEKRKTRLRKHRNVLLKALFLQNHYGQKIKAVLMKRLILHLIDYLPLELTG